ncbi:hypothetical protein QQF64_007221 [Cirrhinus molitorella]|uniref:Tc1-like transposase DDE domain-containing protein n=1 Tax=Cirrhinus molitorella TaxID=172907 RepID=A0ABR3MCC6_9TELE
MENSNNHKQILEQKTCVILDETDQEENGNWGNELKEKVLEREAFSSAPQSPDLNPIEHLWDVVEREIRIMDVQPTNLQQLRNAIMSIWTKISEECFQYLVESMPRWIKAVLKAKGGPTRQGLV